MWCHSTGAPMDPKGRAGRGGGRGAFSNISKNSVQLSVFQLTSAAQNYKDTDETTGLLPFSREDLAWSVAAWIRKCVLDSME